MILIGKDKVLIVQSESLRVPKKGGSKQILTETMHMIYKFLGLCPFRNMPDNSVHETEVAVPKKNTLNATMMQALEEFFTPYNEILEILSQGKISYNEARSTVLCTDVVLKCLSFLTSFLPSLKFIQLSTGV